MFSATIFPIFPLKSWHSLVSVAGSPVAQEIHYKLLKILPQSSVCSTEAVKDVPNVFEGGCILINLALLTAAYFTLRTYCTLPN